MLGSRQEDRMETFGTRVVKGFPNGSDDRERFLIPLGPFAPDLFGFPLRAVENLDSVLAVIPLRSLRKI